MKAIAVSEETWERLTSLKVALKARNYDEVIRMLLKAHLSGNEEWRKVIRDVALQLRDLSEKLMKL